MKAGYRKILTGIHFVALGIAVVNSYFKTFSNYSLYGNIEFGIELFTVISGLVLFFFYRKPFRRIAYYFSIYAFVASLVIVGLIFRGLLFGVILSIILFPIIPDEKEYQQNGITIATPFQGLMAPCCSYVVKERKGKLFEKNLGVLNSEGEGQINFETIQIQKSNQEIVLIYSTDFDEGILKKKIIKR